MKKIKTFILAFLISTCFAASLTAADLIFKNALHAKLASSENAYHNEVRKLTYEELRRTAYYAGVLSAVMTGGDLFLNLPASDKERHVAFERMCMAAKLYVSLNYPHLVEDIDLSYTEGYHFVTDIYFEYNERMPKTDSSVIFEATLKDERLQDFITSETDDEHFKEARFFC